MTLASHPMLDKIRSVSGRSRLFIDALRVTCPRSDAGTVCRMPDSSKPADEAGRLEARPLLVSSPLLLASILFFSCSAFLLYTLVLEEDYLGDKMHLLVDSGPLIGGSALIGLTLAAIAVKRSRKR